MNFFLPALHSVPWVSVVFALLIGSSLQIGRVPFLPAFYLIPIYYWLMFRPRALPLWSLFGLGLFYDALLGPELGVSSLLLAMSWGGAHSVRPLLIAHNFYILWGTFFLYSFIYTGLYLVLRGGDLVLFGAWIYGGLLYPFVTWVLSFLNFRLRFYV